MREFTRLRSEAVIRGMKQLRELLRRKGGSVGR